MPAAAINETSNHPNRGEQSKKRAISRKDLDEIKKCFTFLRQHYKSKNCNLKIFDCLKQLDEFLVNRKVTLESLDIDENIYNDIIQYIEERAIELSDRLKQKGKPLDDQEEAFLKKSEKIFDLSASPPPDLDNFTATDIIPSGLLKNLSKEGENTGFNFIPNSSEEDFSEEDNEEIESEFYLEDAMA
jgi:hypothetical protein